MSWAHWLLASLTAALASSGAPGWLGVGVFIAAAAWLLTRAWRGRAAALRHAVWAAAIAALLAAPLAGAVAPRLPGWSVPVLAPARPVSTQTAAAAAEFARLNIAAPRPAIPAGASARSARPPRAIAAAAAPAAAPTRPWNWRAGLSALWVIWVCGALLCLVRLLDGHRRLRRLTASSQPCRDPATLRDAAEVARAMGLGRCPRLLLGDTITGPLAGGLWRPRVWLPADVGTWPAADRRAALRHEFGHMARGDLFLHAAAQLACALHWPNPLVWFSARRLRLEAELACDDLVLNGGGRASEYAAQLLALARPQLAPAAVLAMSRGSHLETRIMNILDPQRPRRGLTRRGLMLILPLAVLLTLAPQCIHLTRRAVGQSAAQNAALGAAQSVAQPATQPAAAVTTAPATGTVVDAQGQPMAGVQVALGTPEQTIPIRDYHFEKGRYAALTVTSDAQGHFAFPPHPLPHTLVALTPDSYAQVVTPGADPVELRLEPWAAITGTVRENGQPLANVGLEFRAIDVRPSNETLRHDLMPRVAFILPPITTDATGHYTLAKFPPGPGMVSTNRSIVYPMREAEITGYGPQRTFIASPGQTLTLDLGRPGGRTLTGHVVLPSELSTGVRFANILMPIDVPPSYFKTTPTEPEAVSQQQRVSPPRQTPAQRHEDRIRESTQKPRYGVQLNLTDGSFHVSDVQPGSYNLSFMMFNLTDMNRQRVAQMNLYVPPPTPEDHGVIDVGTLKMETPSWTRPSSAPATAAPPARKLHAAVLDPDGRPAPNAQIVAITQGGMLNLQNGQINLGGDDLMTFADRQGNFAISVTGESQWIAAVTDAGYGLVQVKDLESSGKLVLKPWSTVRGAVHIGAHPAAGWYVNLQLQSSLTADSHDPIHFGASALVGPHGEFEIRHAPHQPGLAHATWNDPLWRTQYALPAASYDVAPGATATVKIGGPGRPVSGTVTFPMSVPAGTTYSGELAPTPTPTVAATTKQDAYFKSYRFPVAADGAWHFDAVAPGTYTLTIRGSYQHAVPPKNYIASTTVAIGETSVTIPPGAENVPVTLAPLALTPPSAGAPAP